ncbi:Aminotransferase-like mobile domain-containing protein [Artemisia annua]|uniref:Aminotransferase-like mobile domain-containing protein n=1 Tax=Artemisia annua TaxID=35608 RepID=A0A2U1LHX5_ARTAN|nr:Aminotransferase-like mobile domain-containing protein [Artemisia annua]
MQRHYQTRSRTGTGTSEMEDLNRTATGTGTSREMEHLNKYNDLLRCRTTTDEPEVMEPECTGNAWNAFQEQHKGKKGLSTIWNGMSMAEKQKYGKKVDTIKVVVRCATNSFLDPLENLEPGRRKLLEDSPFRKLLEMKRGVQNNKRIKQLASMFNTEERCLEIEGVKYVVTPEDFSRIMGVEDGDEEIEMPGRGAKKKSSTEAQKKSPNEAERKLLAQLTRDFTKHGKGQIDMEKVVEQLRGSTNEDNVKRAFALLTLRYIICAPSNCPLTHSFLNLVHDVSGLKKKKWATYAIESLVKGIKTLKKGKGNEERYLGGCAIFLQLFAEKMIPKENLHFECDDKRQKRKRDKACRDPPMTAESLYLKAKETVQQVGGKYRVKMQKLRKENDSEYKNDPLSKNVSDSVISLLESGGEDTLATCQRTLDERFEGVARDRRC